MKKLNLKKEIITSAVQTVPKKEMFYYAHRSDYVPRIGDVVLARIKKIGQHTQLENRNARIHNIFENTVLIGAFANRYATDYYHGIVPNKPVTDCHLLARGGVLGIVESKHSSVKAPTEVEILGYVFDKNKNLVNTRNYPIKITEASVKNSSRKLIVVVGGTMNAGKSTAAKALTYSLVVKNKSVAAGKITGIASLKDLLLMEDSGANTVIDFTYHGYPSTYLIDLDKLVDIFEKTYTYLSKKARDYIVIELADGILQRETSFLLGHPSLKEKLYKLIFCCSDPVAVRGGVEFLKEKYNLVPDAISGRAVNSELSQQEIRQFSNIPLFNSMEVNTEHIYSLIK